MASFEDFQKIDIRAGTVLEVQDFPEARNPSYRLRIDLGDAGIKKSCAQITHYAKEDLVGMQVLCVVNFPPRQIGPATSEVLTLGVPDTEGNCILVTPQQGVANGARLY